MNHAYYVKYRLYNVDKVRGISVLAKNKIDAYDKAAYEAIPKQHGTIPYSAWVVSCTYENGNCRTYNTFEGKPY